MRHNLLLVIWNLFSDSEPRERVMLSKTILKNWKEKTNKQTNKQQWKLPVPVLVGCLFASFKTCLATKQKSTRVLFVAS